MSHYQDYIDQCKRDDESLDRLTKMGVLIIIWIIFVVL